MNTHEIISSELSAEKVLELEGKMVTIRERNVYFISYL